MRYHFSVPDSVECPRCHRTEFVRHEKVMRGNEPYVNYKCGGCRYSWQVKDVPKRQARTKKGAPGDSVQPSHEE